MHNVEATSKQSELYAVSNQYIARLKREDFPPPPSTEHSALLGHVDETLEPKQPATAHTRRRRRAQQRQREPIRASQKESGQSREVMEHVNFSPDKQKDHATNLPLCMDAGQSERPRISVPKTLDGRNGGCLQQSVGLRLPEQNLRPSLSGSTPKRKKADQPKTVQQKKRELVEVKSFEHNRTPAGSLVVKRKAEKRESELAGSVKTDLHQIVEALKADLRQ